MRKKILCGIARLSAQHPLKVILFSLAFTFIAGALAQSLKLETQFKDLLPGNHLLVREFDQIVENFSTASMIIVAATGDETELKAFSDALAPRLLSLTDYIQRVDHKQDRDFILRHGLMLQKVKDLKNSRNLYTDMNLSAWLTHLNDNFEKTYIYDEDGISTKEQENTSIAFLNAIGNWVKTVAATVRGEEVDIEAARQAAEQMLVGDEYYLSPNKDMILMLCRPTFSINEMEKGVQAINIMDDEINSLLAQFPSVYASATGAIAINRDEMEAMSADMFITSLIAIILIVILFVISFKMWVAPLLSGVTLIMGVTWTSGLIAVSLGSLNIMTSMFAVILIGLGVDFSVHIISTFTERRAAGVALDAAVEQTLLKSGVGVITGAISTALAFLTLLISETKGMQEFGLVAGSGILLCMIASIVVLPAMLALREKVRDKVSRKKRTVRSIEFDFLGDLAVAIANNRLLTLGIGAMLTIGMLYSAMQITFDQNYLNMEPEGLKSIELQHIMENKFDVTPDFGVLSVSSVQEARRVAEAAKKIKMVGMVTSISQYIPSVSQQTARAAIIRDIKNDLQNSLKLQHIQTQDIAAVVEQLSRLESNIIELAQLAYLGGQDKVDKKCEQLVGNLENSAGKGVISQLTNLIKENPEQSAQGLNQFQTEFSPHYQKTALSMTSTETITLDNLPDRIMSEFTSRKRDQFLVSIYPKQGIWEDATFLEQFNKRMLKLDERITGVPAISYVVMKLIAKDGKAAFTLTLLVVFLLLWWDFGKLKYAATAMVPLLVGAIWMIGVMQLCGLQLTMMNVIGLPMILGIGIDDGIHLLHRYKAEGEANIRTVFSSAGKAVMLTSVTTMLAFGSFTFATYRGLGSLGVALFIGVGACFVASIVLLPAMLGNKPQK